MHPTTRPVHRTIDRSTIRPVAAAASTTGKPWAASLCTTASPRARLLSSCSGLAMLAVPLVLLSVSVSGGARADVCAPGAGYACYYVIQPAPPAPGPNNGDSGSPGAQAPAAQVEVPANNSGSTAISVEVYSQGGAAGRNSHYSDLGGVGGNGGRGGDGNLLTVTADPGIAAVAQTTITSQGGNGGVAGNGSHQGENGVGGDGGNAGAVVAGTSAVPLTGQFANAGPPSNDPTKPPSTGITVTSQGGAGAAGTNWDNASPDSSNYDGGNGGNGGNANTVGVVFAGSASGAQGGILAQSVGGNGGNGGKATSDDFPLGASGGNGGNGGTGSSVSVILQPGAEVSTQGPGVSALSFGGQGGLGGAKGGSDNSGGTAGTGADAGSVYVYNGGTIQTNFDTSPGILAQSFGGAGGTGGAGGGWGAAGGNGGTGGNGGSILIETAPGATITTAAPNSPGILAQSIGGGGGNGGNASGWNSIGGDGAGAGNGGPVTISNRNTITTSSERSSGILAQSIGGGGGNGGNATSNDAVGPVNYVIGGSGAGGGNGSTVQAVNYGSTITTSGLHSSGMVLQSIGGGGGNGGSAYGSLYSAGVSVALSVGGSAGGGGDGGQVALYLDANNNPLPTNTGQILTTGANAHGILGQSIGGGGGGGGTSGATATSYSAATEEFPIPTVSLAAALGGSGGKGGNGNSVTLGNAGLIATAGGGSIGIAGQSIGGGGGTGGDASATASAKGGDNSPVNISAALAIGGSGGSGGQGGAVTIANTGMIFTRGEAADAMLGQSIGGGGGLGGKSASTLGNRTNTGDGGNGAGGSVNGATTSLSNAFASGGAGAVNQYNSVSGLIGVANSALGNVTATRRLRDDPAGDADGLENLGESGGESGDKSSSTNITVHVNVGGQGGAGGDAGGIHVMNTGSIGTVGPMSDGIMAQAIGGGGGRGGAAVSSITSGQVNDGDRQGNVPISVGGRGGHGGSAGDVTVDNSGSITTIGAQSLGIVAQSIAGGGGIAGTSAAKVQGNNAENTSVLSLPIAIGADGGGGGTAGTVTVSNAGTIVTRSHDATGIVAQSIAGGGGIVRTRSSDASDNNGGGAVATGGSYGINLTFGGNCGTTCGKPGEAAPGRAGAVVVNQTGSITTGFVASDGTRFGQNAYGILAQSIGGGGGLVLGGTPNGTNFFGTGTMTGAGNSVSVTVGTAPTPEVPTPPAASIATYGQGAIAVVAQSIGGGGGIAGNTGLTAQRAQFQPSGNHDGNGGPVLVTINQGATLSTDADNTPVILAQSIGGGGGRITSNGYGAYDGTAGGSGTGNTVTVNVAGQILAAGRASPGIFVESVGQGTGANPTGGAAVRINVLPGAVVQGGHDFNPGDGYNAGIYIVGGSTNQDPASGLNNNINNQGTIGSLGTTAIYSTGGWTSVYNQPGGHINGSIDLDNGGGICTGAANCPVTGGTVTNAVGAAINTGPVLRLGTTGTLTNSGTLSIGGNGTIARTAMTGNMVQTGTGRLVMDTDHRTGASDRIDVQGSVRLGGTLELHPAALANRAVTVLTATGGVTLDPSLTSTRTHLFAFDARPAGNSLLVQPRAEFTGQAAGLGANQRAVAAHLQELWNGGANLAAGFTALAGVRDGAAYGGALNSLSGQTVGAISASRFASSRDFSTNMLNDCATFEGAGINQDEASCGWARAFGSASTQDGTRGALGYTTSAWTMQTGGQVQIAPGWFVGGSIAYQSSVFRGDAGSSKVSGDSVLVGGVLRYQAGPWQISGAVDAGYGWYESQRSVQVGSFSSAARAKPDAWHAGAHARLAYQVPFGGEGAGWYVQPRVDLHLSHVRSGGYTESGAAPFNLAVASEGATTFTAVPALEVGGRIRLGDAMVLRPFASAGVELSANRDWAATARLASQPGSRGFRASTPIPDVLGQFSLGAELLNTSNWDLRVQYSAEAGDRYASHTGLARLAYRF